MPFINLDDLAEVNAHKPETIGNDKREVTDEELAEVFFSQAAKFIAGKKPNEDSTATAIACYNLAKACGKQDFDVLVSDKLKTLVSRYNEAQQANNDEALATVRQSAQYFMVFIRRVQSQIARQGYFLQRYADSVQAAQEHPNGDKRVPQNKYDGFKFMVIDGDQVGKVVDDIYDNLTQVYGYLLGIADKWTREKLGDFPFASAMINNDWVDVESPEKLREILDNNKPAMADTSAAMSLLA